MDVTPHADLVSLQFLATSPRGHREAAFLAAKRDRLGEPHVAPLQALAEEIRQATGGEVPAFDPDSGGVSARALFLFEAPGARSTGAEGPRSRVSGSGIISEDNDDPSAQHMWELNREAGLHRATYLAWNVVPWYVGSTTRIRAARGKDVDAALPWLQRLLDRLPDLRVVATFGAVPLRGWMQYLRLPQSTLLPTLSAPHPSARVFNTRESARSEIAAVVSKVARIVA